MMAAVGINMHVLCLAVPQLPKGASVFLFGLFFTPARQSSVVSPLQVEPKFLLFKFLTSDEEGRSQDNFGEKR